MAERWQIALGLTAAGIVAATPLVYAAHRGTHFRNFRVVEEGVLYRSGQLTPTGLDRIVREKGIRTIVSLRAARTLGREPPDLWEEEFCAARGLRHVRIVPRVWSPNESGDIPAEQAVAEFLAVLDRPENHPVLVHCFAGVHRTGTMCAIFRMEYHRWPFDRAVNEMELYGFDPVDRREHIEPFLRAYKPRWKSD
jgi:tyrosine-protein phosphatase SIW14